MANKFLFFDFPIRGYLYQVYIEPEGEDGEAPHISGMVTVWDEQIVQ